MIIHLRKYIHFKQKNKNSICFREFIRYRTKYINYFDYIYYVDTFFYVITHKCYDILFIIIKNIFYIFSKRRIHLVY
jgi:hypothetical protein